MIQKYLVNVSIMTVMAVLGFFGNAFAAIDLTGVDFPITELEAVAALILAALAAVWVIRKVLSLCRS